MTSISRAAAVTVATLLAGGLAIGSALPANAAAASVPTPSSSTAPEAVSAPVVTGTETVGWSTFLTGTGVPRATLMIRPVGGGKGKLANVPSTGSWRVDVTSLAGKPLEVRQLTAGEFSAWVPVSEDTAPVTPPPATEPLTVTGLSVVDGHHVLTGTGTPYAAIRATMHYDTRVALVSADGRWSVRLSDPWKPIVVEQRKGGVTTGMVTYTLGD